jgi:hypothetical protein
MAALTQAKEWRVIVRGKDIGSVMESAEPAARCAAISKFGDEGERATREALQCYVPAGVIYEDDDFDVRLA